MPVNTVKPVTSPIDVVVSGIGLAQPFCSDTYPVNALRDTVAHV